MHVKILSLQGSFTRFCSILNKLRRKRKSFLYSMMKKHDPFCSVREG